MEISENNYKNICVFAASCTAFNNYKLNNIEKLLSFQNLFNMDLTEYIDSIKNELDEKDLEIVKRIIEHYPPSAPPPRSSASYTPRGTRGNALGTSNGASYNSSET
jgi:hypothetical protein